MNETCWFLSKGGGGSMSSVAKIIVRRTAAVGDSLCAVTVADKLIELGYPVEYQTHLHNHCVLKRHRGLSGLTAPQGNAHINLDQTYERDTGRREKTFHRMFLEAANRQIGGIGVTLKEQNCKPRIIVQPHEKEITQNGFAQFLRPWIFCCPRSNSYNVRQVHDGTWIEFAKLVPGTKFWLGNHGPAPAGFVDLQARHLDNVILWLSAADLLVTVDTGPMHIAAALNTPIVAINQSSSPNLHLNDQCDFVEVSPDGLDCLNCQLNVCPKNADRPPCQRIAPEKLAATVNARLRSIFSEDVSAVISVFRPDAAPLNHAIENALPQVEEVVVSVDAGGTLPQGLIQHAKVRYVTTRERNIGYGRKANFGARNANGKYLLFLNSDCYLNERAVEFLKAEMKEGVGMVGHLLRHLDGRIQHGGKFRAPNGGIGYGHEDHLKYHPTITESREVENVTGASIFVRREAYFDVDGHNELYFLYCDDDELCMSVRKSGWKIIYTPHATAIHDEHLETKKSGDIMTYIRASQKIFGERWKQYFAHNKNNPGLGTFDYLV